MVAAFSLVAIVTGLLAAFGGNGGTAAAGPAPASASRLLPGGPAAARDHREHRSAPRQAAVDQSRVTALGYQGGSEGALALVARRHAGKSGAAEGGLPAPCSAARAVGRAGTSYRAAKGPPTSAIDVGAAPGTDVFSPVDGTVVAIDDVVLNGSTLGSQVDIQPTVAPSLVISISHIQRRPRP